MNHDLEQRSGKERRAHDHARTRWVKGWLGMVTVLTAIALVSLQSQAHKLNDQVREFNAGRIEATQQRCDLDSILVGLIKTAHVSYLAKPLRDNLADCQRLLATYKAQR